MCRSSAERTRPNEKSVIESPSKVKGKATKPKKIKEDKGRERKGKEDKGGYSMVWHGIAPCLPKA